MRKHLLPALTLFLLSPLIGELVSGSSPPANWLHPMTFLLVVPLYGSGAVLARELAVRGRAGGRGGRAPGAEFIRWFSGSISFFSSETQDCFARPGQLTGAGSQ